MAAWPITRHQLATALGVDRFAANDLLTRYGVTEDLPTLEDIERQVTTIEGKLPR